jgi:hypothetical protein
MFAQLIRWLNRLIDTATPAMKHIQQEVRKLLVENNTLNQHT